MHSKWLGRIGFVALVTGVLGGSGAGMGCAAERDPINRVQLNALPKSFFVGQKYDDPADDPEFYARSMVIDVPYGESGSDFLMFTNTINSISKIKWQVTESKLIGRVSFERITGTDGKGPTPADALSTTRDPSKPVSQNNGLVVYEFPIQSQFDIRRDYNPQTGEESNVIVENSSDRPWNQRDYIRVDFSQNLVTTAYDFDTLSLLGVYNGISWAPLEYDIRDPNDKNAPVLDIDNGYFDVTNKVFANPQTLDLGGGFKLPGCMLPNLIRGGTQPVGNCNPNEITLRQSFKRVTNTDYEPLDWTGQQFEAYGAFMQERFGYAKDYGLADANWHRFVERYNIWERSHYYKDPVKMEGAVACKVDNDCSGVGEVAGMSHCDKFSEKCTLPFKDRKAKPIYWHYADGSPELYFAASREAAEEWDANIRAAIVASRYAECKRFTPGDDCGAPITGNFAEEENALFLVKEINACRRGEVPGYENNPKGCNDLAQELGTKRGYSDATIGIAQMDPMVTLCHSPVSDKDPAGCGKVGTVARLGDLRYHLITNISDVQTNSPWGIMSDANDPTTGEKLAASVNVWTYVNDLAARGLIDTLRYIGGEYSTSDITDGTYVNKWVEAARVAANNGGAVLPQILPADELDKRVAAAAGTTVANLRSAEKLRVGGKLGGTSMGIQGSQMAQLRQQLLADMKKVEQTNAAFDAPSVNAPIYEARRNLLKGTPMEAALITPAMQQLAQSSYGSLDPSVATSATSVFQGLSPQLRRVYEHRLDSALAARGACIMPFEATAPLAYVAFGDVLQQKFGKFNPSDSADVQQARADKMKDYIRRRYQYAVIAHEMGHSFGLRHNFVSSSDAWNFRPQYWQLRTNDKKYSSTPCDANGTSDGKTCVGPRWLDPVTANETKNLIHMWAQSSTMEYPGETTQDLLGLGRYDFGAARMFYGQVATVYDNARFKNTAGPGGIAQDHQDDFGGLLGYRYGGFSNPIHYSALDGAADLIEKCSTVNVEDFKPANWNDDLDGQWHPVADGRIVSNEQGQYTRCTEPKVDFVQWDQLKDEDTKTHAHDSAGRVRVPHGFASDDWADLGNVAVFRHDNGADLYEVMQFWIAQQEMTHIFTNYRKGRTDFSLWGAFNRTLSRYHEKMRDAAKAISLYITLARDTVSQYQGGTGAAATDPEGFVADVLKQVASDNVAASAIAFDHFTHVFSRPEPGEHGSLGSDDPVLRSFSGTAFANPGRTVLQVPNGVMGGFGNITLGGRPIENALADNQGRDYNRDYTLNVGDYYEKAFTAMLFTESADNFISASRDDFVDPRFRAVSLADVFPDGFRRWLGNNLTGDDQIKGVYVRGTGTGTGTNPPDLDSNGFATIGNTSWWPTAGLETCFPQGEKIACRNPFATPQPPLATAGIGPVVDPQVGWEQQKFALLFSLVYLPENARTNWLDQMRIYQMGSDSDPGFPNRIEYHDPTGKVWVAETFGTETLYGKVVQKGIAARVLQYANEILAKGVVTTPVVGQTATWNVPKADANGDFQYTDPKGAIVPSCDNSLYCTKAKNYTAMPKLLREAQAWLGFTRGLDLKGVY
jgi:hypothetical protein